MYNDLLKDIDKDISGDWGKIIEDINDKKIENIYIDYFNLVDSLIKLNKENRKNRNIRREDYDLISYLREFCTVKLDIGRITGKTSYIINRATKNDIVIVSRMLIQKRMFDKKCESYVYTINDILGRRYKIKNYNNIFVDDFSYITINPEKKEYILRELYYFLGNSSIDQTFILLG